MKLTLISLLLILTFLPSYGQKYGNIWQFEKGAGILLKINFINQCLS